MRSRSPPGHTRSERLLYFRLPHFFMQTMQTATLDTVLLLSPTHLAGTVLSTETPAMSWIQIARIGSFTSARYGKFSITREDLAQMLHNFTTVTPKPPTRLPIDYDHLSMDPQRPGDGVAAGWINKLELRKGGNELWAEIEWTEDGAKKVRAKEYQFVSPSFVKDHTYKDGTKIGTTLLAAAITNHPFLEGMAAVTLSSGLVDELAVQLDNGEYGTQPGQKVQVKPEAVHMPQHMGVTFEIAEVVGEGEDAFVSLKAPDGSLHRWFRASELMPAAANPNPQNPNPTNPNPPEKPGEKTMSDTYKLTDTEGKEFTVTREVAEKVIGKVVPEGAVVIQASDLEALRGKAGERDGLTEKVTALQTQVTNLSAAAEASAKQARTATMKATLDRLSKGGFVDKPTRDWAEKKFGAQLDLAEFDEWAALQTHQLVKTEHVHGSGEGGDTPEPNAGERLMTLANKIAKEERISLRDALVKASAQDPKAAEEYREGFAPAEQRVH